MNEEYIKEETWFDCTINNEIYHCCFNYKTFVINNKTSKWIELTVKKYVVKKWWIFKWKSTEFEYTFNPDVSYNDFSLINDSRYFKVDKVKSLVEKAILNKYYEEKEKYREKIKQENIKVVNKI